MELSRRVRVLRQARARMIDVRERILRSVEGRSDAELLQPPSPGAWSAAEVLDHLRVAESKLVKGLTKVERGEPVRLPSRVWFYRLPMGVAFVPFRLSAPAPVRPRPAAELSPAEVLGGLAASRRDLLAVADRLGEERFSRLLFPHFLLGRFDGLDWFRFIARHEERHREQLVRTLG